MSDLIDRQAAIDRLTEYGNGRAVFISVGEAIIRIEQLPPAQLGTNLAEVGTDCISRQAVLDALNNIEIPRNASWYQYYQQALTAVDKLPPAQPAQHTPDQNGDLWITVPDIDKVMRIFVQESKSKFCRIFYEEQPERIKGHWIAMEKKNLFRCSECGVVIYSESEYDRNEFHKFCGRCGAEMREVAE